MSRNREGDGRRCAEYCPCHHQRLRLPALPCWSRSLSTMSRRAWPHSGSDGLDTWLRLPPGSQFVITGPTVTSYLFTSSSSALQVNSRRVCIPPLGICRCQQRLKCPTCRFERRLNSWIQRIKLLEIRTEHFTSLLLQICKILQCINELGILNMSPLMLLKAPDWQHIFKV